MTLSASDLELKEALKGKVVQAATSSLKILAITFSDNTGLVLEAVGTGNTPSISSRVVDVKDLPVDSDAVCRVDWNWICSSTVNTLQSSKDSVRFVFEPAGPLTVAVQVWQGSPFLAFTPWKAAGSK